MKATYSSGRTARAFIKNVTSRPGPPSNGDGHPHRNALRGPALCAGEKKQLPDKKLSLLQLPATGKVGSGTQVTGNPAVHEVCTNRRFSVYSD